MYCTPHREKLHLENHSQQNKVIPIAVFSNLSFSPAFSILEISPLLCPIPLLPFTSSFF